MFDDPLDGAGIVVGGSEVVGGGVLCGGGAVGREQVLGEAHVAVKGLEDVLPGADGVRAAGGDGGSGEKTADEVGNEAVERPVAAANDVAGAGGGYGYAMPGEVAGGEEGLAEGGGDDLGAGLGGGVGVVAAEGGRFRGSPRPTPCFRSICRSSRRRRPGRGRPAHGVEHARGARTLVSKVPMGS